MTATDGDATARVARQFARFVGAGYAFYLVLMLGEIAGLSAHMAAWWTPAAVVVIFGPGLILLALTFRQDTAWLRPAARTAALAYLFGVATWPLAWQGPLLENGAGVWFSTFPGGASMAAALAWRRPAVAFLHLTVACAAVQTINHLARQPSSSSPLLPDIVYTISYCALFVGAAAMAVRTGQLLDSTRAATHAVAARAAAQQARMVERERFNALTHDGVMATLLSAARQGNTSGLRAQCRSTLEQLDRLRDVTLPDEPLGIEGVLAHLRTAASEADADTVVTTDVHPDAGDITVPAEVARALGAALAEAVRNSVRHAGSADRRVAISLHAGLLKVLVTDNGVGFDPRAVAAHRLGLSVSIKGRMRQLPGGAAAVESSPQAGTRVLLSWREPV